MKQSDIEKRNKQFLEEGNNLFLDKIIQAVEAQIKITVNGKIEKLHTLLNEHIEESRPAMEVYNTANNIGRFIKWISGVLLAAALLYTYIKGWII